MLFSCAMFAQPDSMQLRTASPKILKKLGKNALKQNDPGSAISYFEAYLARNKKDAEVTALLGKSFQGIRDYERAQHAYLRAYTIDKKAAGEALYYHALMQKSNGKYDSAAINFRQFRKEYKGEDKALKRIAAREIIFCDSVQKMVLTDPKILIDHLDTTINKVNAEGSPLNLNDSMLVFNSLRTEKTEYIIEDDTASVPKKKLYKARFYNNKWNFAGEWEEFNSEEFNTSNVSFSADRQRMYFTRCKPNIMEEMICAIYMSEKKGDAWSEPVKLPKPVNINGYTATQPAVTRDPQKGYDVIYFVSNRPKGKGGLDIWYTMYNKKKGEYMEPKNIGNKINTVQDEITPYFDNETRALYYSSDGTGGLGGFDIYRATGDGKRWTGAQNMGIPLNSGADDVYYTISPNRHEGFFVSNRKGGNALKNSTCCDDIYNYKNKDFIEINVDGTVKEGDSVAIANATVDVYIKDKITNERFLVKSLVTDPSGNFSTRLEPSQEYVFVVRKKDFLSGTDELSTNAVTSSQRLKSNINLGRKPKGTIIIPNIEYEFNSAALTPRSMHSIDSVLLSLLENNPEIVVQIRSHTDSKGNDNLNMKLSQKRAESVINYLVKKGIDPKRMEPKGFGESLPIAPNDNTDGSDNPEGRARNRRTEFQIIGSINLELGDDEVEVIQPKER